MLLMKSVFKWLIICFSFALIILLIGPIYLTISIVKHPVFIWWTQDFPGVISKIPDCPHKLKCEFTNVRQRRYEENVKGFLFYGSHFNYLDLPLPREPDKKIWGLIHEESPRNTPVLAHAPILELFNYSSTVSRYSDVPLTLQFVNIEDLGTSKYFIKTEEKNNLLKQISPILYIQTDCDTSTYRDVYVQQLMLYIPVDSYGKCLNNKQLPKQFGGDYLNNLNSDSFLKFVARYKFTIAFENGVCEDYITEKLWRPLKVGSVPLYLGSPSVRDWLPNQNSAIIAQDFTSPKELASYISYLNNHNDKYEHYLQHIISKNISNENLMNAITKKRWLTEKDNFDEAFECFLCEKIYANLDSENMQSSVVNYRHYDCPKPSAPLFNKSIVNEWLSVWFDAKSTAYRVNDLVMKFHKHNFTEYEIK